MWGRGLSPCFSPSRYTSGCFSTLLLKRIFLSPLNYFVAFVNNQPTMYTCMYILSGLLHCWSMPLSWCQYQTGLIIVALVSKAKSESSNSVLPLQECFDYSKSFAFLHSYIKYNININLESAYLFLFLKSVLEFYLNYVELWSTGENSDILTILDFPSHQYGVSSHWPRSSFTFLINVS